MNTQSMLYDRTYQRLKSIGSLYVIFQPRVVEDDAFLAFRFHCFNVCSKHGRIFVCTNLGIFDRTENLMKRCVDCQVSLHISIK